MRRSTTQILLLCRRTYYRLYLRLGETWLFTLHRASGALETNAFMSASKILQITFLLRTNRELTHARTHARTRARTHLKPVVRGHWAKFPTKLEINVINTNSRFRRILSRNASVV